MFLSLLKKEWKKESIAHWSDGIHSPKMWLSCVQCNSVTDSPAQLLLCRGSTLLLSQTRSGLDSLPVWAPGTYFGCGRYRRSCTEEFKLKHFRKKSLPRRKDSRSSHISIFFAFVSFLPFKNLFCYVCFIFILKKKKKPSGHPRGYNVQWRRGKTNTDIKGWLAEHNASILFCLMFRFVVKQYFFFLQVSIV